MASKQQQEAQNPLILRCHRLMEAFAKSDEERDFYLDRREGFIVYADLDKSQEELDLLESELKAHSKRYCSIPKLSFYETKKIMEGFVNEKVYDIDTKEKLLDIIQSKEARENFLEFIYDHHSEYDKWQQYYQERSRIRIIEWLRDNHYHFVFEEDLDLPKTTIEKLKLHLFDPKVGKDLLTARKALISKAKSYYSIEALNPRPKRGRPPKQAVKLEIEPQVTTDIYTTVPPSLRLFLFIPDISSISGLTFSSKFENEDELLAHRRQQANADNEINLNDFNQKLSSLRSLSNKWTETDPKKAKAPSFSAFDDDEDDDDDFDDDEGTASKINGKKLPPKSSKKAPAAKKPAAPKKKAPPAPAPKKTPPTKAQASKEKKPSPAKKPLKAAPPKKATVPSAKKKPMLRTIIKTQKAKPKGKTANAPAKKKPLVSKKPPAKASNARNTKSR